MSVQVCHTTKVIRTTYRVRWGKTVSEMLNDLSQIPACAVFKKVDEVVDVDSGSSELVLIFVEEVNAE